GGSRMDVRKPPAAVMPEAPKRPSAFKKIWEWNSKTGEAFEKMNDFAMVFRRTPFGFILGGIVSGVGRIVGALTSAVTTGLKLGTVLAGVGTAAAVGGAVKVVQGAMFSERSRMGLGAMVPGKSEEAFKRVRLLARDLGLSVSDVTDQM